MHAPASFTIIKSENVTTSEAALSASFRFLEAQHEWSAGVHAVLICFVFMVHLENMNLKASHVHQLPLFMTSRACSVQPQHVICASQSPRGGKGHHLLLQGQGMGTRKLPNRSDF